MNLDGFLAAHPLKRQWLGDIISDLLHQPKGTAHVSSISHRLMTEREVESSEQAVTRTINNFCSDAADFKKDSGRDYFERVDKGTYRLRSFPNAPGDFKPSIHFENDADERTWDEFSKVARKQHGENGTWQPMKGN